jgi:two-component system sensor histidine kinase PilS (NtrC family)
MASAPVSRFPGDDDPFFESTFERLWRGFMVARAAIASVLLLVHTALHMLSGGNAAVASTERWIIGLCATYVLATLAVRFFTQPQAPGRAFDPQWVFTIGIDLVVISALQLLQAAGLNYSPLFALPVLMAAVLGSRLLALGTAAGVALLMLGEAWVQSLLVPAEMASRFLQAGLAGIGYFALSVIVHQLAARLAREEEAARIGRRAVRMQAQVNELVIEALAEGVLVVDPQGVVHAANPAARILLGIPRGEHLARFSLAARQAWEPLRELASSTFVEGGRLAETSLPEKGTGPRRVHVRTRLTGAGGTGSEGLCVMFLQDLREMEARLRTEKLAAMGRMSAAVAHEIRNPLAAIAQANELMEEDLHEPALRQLSGLVRKNTQRLAQIVEEILDISRARQSVIGTATQVNLDATVAATCRDWIAQTRSAARVDVKLATREQRVRFEADHLRRILVNLLDNALRYAGDRPDSIVVSSAMEGPQAVLRVWSDGAPLEAAVQQHLFEPFFSSESRSSGLGLFICRELCERHGAAMTFQRCISGTGERREGNEFAVIFAPHAVSSVAGATPYDTIGA